MILIDEERDEKKKKKKMVRVSSDWNKISDKFGKYFWLDHLARSCKNYGYMHVLHEVTSRTIYKMKK